MARLDPRELFELRPDLPDLGRPVLVQALRGFVDAGDSARIAVEHLLETCESQVVATFDVDQLFDYRARRPLMVFTEDHWESYDEPELALHALIDAAGTPFLLLTGPEPDVQWERFVAAMELLIEALNVRLTVGLDAIPMAVPHTRHTGLTAHATRSELIADHQPWISSAQVPSSAGHLLEYRLGRAGRDAVGYAAHVPHYLAQADYPGAAETLLGALLKVTGLTLPLDAVRTAAERRREEIDAEVAESVEVTSVVSTLEQQYDAFMAQHRDSLLGRAGGKLPSGDELGAQFERFLAEQTGRNDPPTS